MRWMVMVLGALLISGQARAVTAEGQQELVDRATLAAEDILTDSAQGDSARAMLRQARAVMICPRIFKAGFFFGGEGGACALLARGGQGSWSAPAFYAVGGGSFGFQAGIQDAELLMVIRTEAGLRAVMDSQVRLGADASVALVTIGGGVEGATTANFNADIVAFAKTRGLFAGISLAGTLMSSDSGGDQVYYGRPVGPIEILMSMSANNQGADPMRAMLMRYGAAGYAPAPETLPNYAPSPNYAPEPRSPPTYPPAYPTPPAYVPPPPGGVQQQDLPPPR